MGRSRRGRTRAVARGVRPGGAPRRLDTRSRRRRASDDGHARWRAARRHVARHGCRRSAPRARAAAPVGRASCATHNRRADRHGASTRGHCRGAGVCVRNAAAIRVDDDPCRASHRAESAACWRGGHRHRGPARLATTSLAGRDGPRPTAPRVSARHDRDRRGDRPHRDAPRHARRVRSGVVLSVARGRCRCGGGPVGRPHRPAPRRGARCRARRASPRRGALPAVVRARPRGRRHRLARRPLPRVQSGLRAHSRIRFPGGSAGARRRGDLPARRGPARRAGPAARIGPARQLRKPAAAQGWPRSLGAVQHGAGPRRIRGAGDRKHHRRHHRAQAARTAAVAVAKDGRPRLPGRRRGPRLQQRPDGDSRLRGSGAARPRARQSPPQGSRGDQPLGPARRRPHPPAPDLQPPAADRAADLEPERGRRRHGQDVAPADRTGGRARHGPGTEAGNDSC